MNLSSIYTHSLLVEEDDSYPVRIDMKGYKKNNLHSSIRPFRIIEGLFAKDNSDSLQIGYGLPQSNRLETLG
jgi:hypothetical protein